MSFRAAERSKQSYLGIYPFDWQSGWEETFHELRADGGLLVAPILQNLILPRDPQATLDWVNRICEWDFHSIIPCHFDAPIPATPSDFRQAFSFLESKSTTTLLAADIQLIKEIDRQLTRWRIIKRSYEL